MTDAPKDVLVVAAEDYTGTSNVPAYDATAGPHYLDYYTDALTANGKTFDVYDVDARGRTAPDHLGVLGHYDAVVWYTGNDLLTREPGQPGGTGAATLANNEMLELRAFLNEGGKLLYTGRSAGWQYANAFDYNPVTTPPFCDNVDQTVDDGCLLLSDDFLQYWLGAQLFIEDGGTNAATDEPFGMSGTADGPFAGTAWTLNGGDSADNHHANDSRGTTQSFLTTSSLHPPEDYPQFTSDSLASWDTGVAGAFSPHTGDHYLYSGRADVSYKRLTNTIDLTGGGVTDPTLSFFTSYDTELDWDFMFVEAHTVGQDDWTTLPDQNGHTTQNTGESCPEGWHTDPNDEIHPFLAHYQTFNGTGAACDPTGTTGEWNAATGRSNGWQEWSIDLSDYVGSQVEVSISYASDWGAGHRCVARRRHRVRGSHRVVRGRPRRVGRVRRPVRQRRQPQRLGPHDRCRLRGGRHRGDEPRQRRLPHGLLRVRARGRHVGGRAQRPHGTSAGVPAVAPRPGGSRM